MLDGRTLLLGATGRLGKRFYEDQKEPPLAPTRKELVLTDFAKLREYILDLKPALIINCAAMNGLEACETRPDLAFAINTQAPATMAAAAHVYGATFVHFSTDYAAVGEETSTDAQRVSWLAYGTSKRLGEIAIASAALDNYLIFRVSSIYDSADMGGALDAVRQWNAQKGTLAAPIKVLRQLTTPISTRTIVEKTNEALKGFREGPSRYTGLYNLVTSDPEWKTDFALEALRLFANVESVALTTGTLALPRPWVSVLPNDAFTSTFCDLPTALEDLQTEYERWQTDQSCQTSHSPSPESPP